MKTKHILFVEDEKPQHDLFETAIGDWNAAHVGDQKAFTYDIAKTVEEAEVALDRIRCDAALFDIRLKSGGGGKAEPVGNGLARVALNDRGIPAAIMSANTDEVDEDIRNAGAVEVFDKNAEIDEAGNVYDRAVAWFSLQWDMMDVLASSRRAMEGSAADIFLQRLWPRWKMFADLETADRKQLEQIVTRQYVSHMAEMLGLDDPENVSWHPFENYVSPALMKGRAHTGDIFELNNALWVVLTPQCDMATQKVDNAILAKCASGIEDWEKMVGDYRDKISTKLIDKSTKFLQKHVNQNLEPSRHFLPPLPGKTEPLLVHFSSVMTIPLPDLNAAIEYRIASISSAFLSNIVQRFGSYLSRTGQPNIDIARF